MAQARPPIRPDGVRYWIDERPPWSMSQSGPIRKPCWSARMRSINWQAISASGSRTRYASCTTASRSTFNCSFKTDAL